MPGFAVSVAAGGTGGRGAAGVGSGIFVSAIVGPALATNASGVSSFIFIGGFVGGTGAGVGGKGGGVGIVGVPRGGGVTGSVLPNAASTAA